MAEVRDLICQTVDLSYPKAYPPQAIVFFKGYHSVDNIKLDAAHGTTLIAVVGTGTLLDGKIKKKVFVGPEHQGRGIGGELMRSLISEGKVKRLRSVSLNASLVSRRMYERRGFFFIRNGYNDLGNGLALDHYLMVKDL